MLQRPLLSALTIALALSGLLASSAGAATWFSNGDKAIASTNAGAIRLVVHSGGSQVVLGCSSTAITGTLHGPSNPGSIWLNAATVTPANSGCTLSGSAGYSFVCSTAALRAISYTGGDTLATADGGDTSGTLANVDCRYGFGATTCSTITGTIPAHLVNPNPIATGSARLTLGSTGQSLTAHKIGSGCGFLPDGPATIGSPTAGTGIGDLTYIMDGPSAPYIYRGT
jgi:hypothetical protein